MKTKISRFLFLLLSVGGVAHGQPVSLFNGVDLTGWHVDIPHNDAADEPVESFLVRNGMLVSLGTPNGHLITEASHRDYRLEVEYRFAGEPGNCGVLVHASTPRALYKMFPASIEVQMMHENAGDFWCIHEDIAVDNMLERRGGPKEKWGGKSGDLRRIKNLTDGSEKPLGEWNRMVVECLDDKVRVWVNGDLVNDGYNSTVSEGQIALQAEGSEVEFRKVMLTPIDKLSDAAPVAETRLAKPLPKQIAFADWEVGAFFHYDLNPFTGQEHGDGQESPSLFNPTDLDVEQWIVTAKAMGARYAVLTARHEGGFCLWPSRTTDYTVASSPYRGGEGDVVREFVEACRKHGLKVGLYHTAAFDAHEALRYYDGPIGDPTDKLSWNSNWKLVWKSLGDPENRRRFNATQVEQFRELLTDYGPIDFMWSDHWDATDPDGIWRKVTKVAEELQPEMVMMGPDSWVPGNETGHVVYPMWNAINTVDGTVYSRPAATEAEADRAVKNSYGLLETDVRTGHPLGEFWRVRECTTNTAFHYGGWFWHPPEIKPTRPRKTWEHLDLYYRTVGLGANTIINLTPDTTGRIPDDFVTAAKALGDELRKRFSDPIAEIDTVQTGDVVELAWDAPREINTVVTMENIANGQRVARYTLEAMVDGAWRELEPRNRVTAWKPYNAFPGYQTIGHKKIDRVAPVTTDRVRFRCLESVAGTPEIRRLSVFRCDPIVREFNASYPYLSGVDTIRDWGHGGVKRDLDYKGGPIELGGVAYSHGLLTCPDAITKRGVAEFDLTTVPKAAGIEAVIGIEDMNGDAGSCVFIVEAARDGEWEQLYKSPRMTGRSEPIPIRVTIPAGATELRLTATDGGDNANSDHAMWADAKFTE